MQFKAECGRFCGRRQDQKSHMAHGKFRPFLRENVAEYVANLRKGKDEVIAT